MTEASNGLRKALARNAGVQKLSTNELLAQMTDEQKAALAATLAPAANVAAPANASEAPAAGAEDDEDDDDLEMKKKDKAKKKDGDEYADDKAETETQRAQAVIASEHFAGREKQAAKLLGNAKLSSAEIISILADLSPAAPADPEADARAAMQAALRENAPSGVEANDGTGKTNPAASAASVWDGAIATVFGNNKAA